MAIFLSVLSCLVVDDADDDVGDDEAEEVVEEPVSTAATFQPFKCTADMYDPDTTVDTEVIHAEAVMVPVVIKVCCTTLNS